MLRRIWLFLLVTVFVSVSVQAYEYTVGSEQRWGKDMDQWREEGSSSVTGSPIFNNGIRLTCWTLGDEENYEYAIVHVEYCFSVPSGARSMRIYIPYDGNDGQGGNSPVGRLWLRRRGSSEGDSFVLRAGEHSETIRLPVGDYLLADSRIELRVVAEGSQRIDVNYIKVDFFSSTYEVRVVTRYYTDYSWRPWYDYGYWYFYHSRELWWDPWLECWVEYIYPSYSYHWGIITTRYNAYLYGYYDGRRDERSWWRWQARTGGPRDIVAWSPRYADAHRAYRASVGDTRGSSRAPRERVRSVLAEHKRHRSFDVQTNVQTDRTRTDSAPSRVRGEVRRGTATDLKQRREAANNWLEQREGRDDRRAAPRGNKEIRSRDTETGKIRREDAGREEDRVRTGTSLDDKRSSSTKGVTTKSRPDSLVRTGMSVRSGTSLRESPASDVRSAPVRESGDSSLSELRVKTRSKVVRTSPQPQVKEQREVNRTPVRTEPRPTPQPQVKQRPEEQQRSKDGSVRSNHSRQDDDDEKDKKEQRSYSTSGRSNRQREGRR